MNILFLIKILAGLAIGAISLLAFFFALFMIWLYRSYPKKLTEQDFKKLKSRIMTFLEYYFLIGGVVVIIYYCPFILLFIGLIGLLKYSPQLVRLVHPPSKEKSLTRQRMEALRQKYQQPTLTKKERLRLRKLKHLLHRQMFFNRLAKRNR